MKKACNILLGTLSFLLVISCGSGCSRSSEPGVMDYEGVHFQYPGNWEAGAKVLVEDVAYVIHCKEKGNGASIFSISFIDGEVVPEELLGNILSNLTTQNNYTQNPFVKDEFSGYECISSDYTFTIDKQKFFGRVYGFVSDERCYAIMKQSDSEESLSGESYAMIEETFEISSEE